MRISVMGTGYVGLVAGACLSDSGNHVTCIDVNAEKIAQLNRGEIPIFEPGLEELVLRNTKANRLSFTTDFAASIKQANMVFIAVGTPEDEDGSADLSYVLKAAEMIRDHAAPNTVVVIKSTVPVGTADKVRAILKEAKGISYVISNPEFLKEGQAIDDFMRPERVVIGTDSEVGRLAMTELYGPFVRSGNPIIFMNNRSAEVCKYAANSFLAMKISFINNLANLCEKVGANIHDVREGIITDSRIGRKFLYPGCGYGGSCFPKDVLAITKLAEEYNFPMALFEAVHSVNEEQKQVIFGKIQKHFGNNLKGRKISVWGLAFKPQTDDMREAPSVTLIEALLQAGCTVTAYDPVAHIEARRIFGDQIKLEKDVYGGLDNSDALAIMTEWNEFRSPDFDRIKGLLKTPTIFDGRNLYDPTIIERRGFKYYCIGRPDPT